MSSVVKREVAEVFEPLLAPARYKAAFGGRGSGKSHFFAGQLVQDSLIEPGLSGEGMRAVCIREVQKDLTQSAKLLIEDKLSQFGLGAADGFKVFRDVIQTPGDGIIIFKGMQDYTADSIKSLEKFKRAWWEEAHTASAKSVSLLRPTIRTENSELWFSWNPTRKVDAVDQMFRGASRPTGSAIVRANYSDNPWFPAVLEQERLDCFRDAADQYPHIWDGEYVTVIAGAYYAKQLSEARAQGRISRVPADPLMRIKLFADIGGTGARADAFSFIASQFVGREIRCLNHYTAQGQPLAAHVQWLNKQGYTPDKADIWLPHDGVKGDQVYDTSYESALRQLGYDVTIVPNQGTGAASLRVEAGRRLFPSIWFNEATCGALLDSLGWYHEKLDGNRGIGLGPDHDWSSHDADAFGLMCITYEKPAGAKPKRYEAPKFGAV